MMSQRGVVVVTGAGSGIGRALAVGFAMDGYTVAGIGRKLEALEQTGRLCPAGRFLWRTADVASPADVTAAIESIVSDAGPVAVMICGAAIYPRDYFLDQSADEWIRTMLVNVAGVANCCRAVLPDMLARNAGRIVVLGSLADMNPIPASSAYSASKGALHVVVRAIAAEIDPGRFPNVLINEFNPGATRTAMSEAGDDPAVLYPRVRRLVDFPSGGPTGRMFVRDREFRPNETLKGKIRRVVLARLGLG